MVKRTNIPLSYLNSIPGSRGRAYWMCMLPGTNFLPIYGYNILHLVSCFCFLLFGLPAPPPSAVQRQPIPRYYHRWHASSSCRTGFPLFSLPYSFFPFFVSIFQQFFPFRFSLSGSFGVYVPVYPWGLSRRWCRCGHRLQRCNRFSTALPTCGLNTWI